jgi:hypothetical protein
MRVKADVAYILTDNVGRRINQPERVNRLTVCVNAGKFAEPGEAAASARRLALCWNSHDELVELAGLAADVIDDELEGHAARHSLGNLHARLRAVVAKATNPSESEQP